MRVRRRVRCDRGHVGGGGSGGGKGDEVVLSPLYTDAYAPPPNGGAATKSDDIEGAVIEDSVAPRLSTAASNFALVSALSFHAFIAGPCETGKLKCGGAGCRSGDPGCVRLRL